MDPNTPEQYLIMLGVCCGTLLTVALIVWRLPRESLVYRSWFVQL